MTKSTFAIIMLTWGVSCGIYAQNLRSYTNKSILSSGRTVKIRVQEEGLYSFTYDELLKMGFSNPKNVHLRGYGGELLNEDFTADNHYIDDLIDQPVVDLGDRIAFYMRGIVGYNKVSNYTTNDIGIFENYASDYSYYFLHEESNEAKRIEYADQLDEEPIKETSFTDIQWQTFNDINPANSGRTWYGNSFSNGNSKTFTFNFGNLIPGETARIYSNVMSISSDKGIFHLTTNMSDIKKEISGITKEDKKNHVYGYDANMTAEILQSSSNTISATYNYTTGSSTGAGYFNYIIAAAKCNLRGDASYRMVPISPSTIDKNITYAALNSSSDIQVWDVSDIWDIKRIPTRMSKDSLIFTVKTRPTVGRYIMVRWDGKYKTPEIVGNVENQNLHALKDIEYVVVTNPEYIGSAKELAEFHQKEDGMNVAVVTDEQVYNEFSSGTPDPTAIRAFMKMLWDKTSMSDYGVFPQYLLLLGDGSFDNRGKLKITDFNKLVTYQSKNSLNESSSFTSDDYFGYLDDNSLGYELLYRNNQINIGVGRFPVYKLEQAESLVEKVKQYYASKPGDWRSRFIALADDNEERDYSSGYHTFLREQEDAILTLLDADPRMNVSRIYWDNFNCDASGGTRRYPEVTNEITKKMSEGALIFNYLGHSSYNAISAEHSFSITQAQNIYNNILPLWIAGSCNLSQFDDFHPCFGEEIMLNPKGGAIASIGSVRIASSTQNLAFDKALLRELYNPTNDFRIGKMYRAAKTDRGSDSNKMNYVLLGDPGIKLKVPELNIIVDSIETTNKDGEIVKADTLKGLSKVKIYCHIEDETGSLLNQFNGTVNINLKDKEIKSFTKANKVVIDKDNNPVRLDPFSYRDRQSTLFSGSTVVRDGKFEQKMIIPKDINYKVGNGRLFMYAYDELNGWDAMGANEDIIIGGSVPDIESDSIGPNIELTTTGIEYKDGYKVNSTPMIYVKLNDRNGINATGSSIGHNITLTIDENSKDIISLNSYFKYDVASCTSGSINYHIEKKLSEGWHTIKVKAWDLHSNSSESTIRVYVKENIAPDIETLTVYPNPVKDKFVLRIKTNRPDELQTIECFLSDFSGRTISKKELKDKMPDGIWNIDWDLHENGQVTPGLYFLVVRIATEESDFAEKAEKIVVIAQ